MRARATAAVAAVLGALVCAGTARAQDAGTSPDAAAAVMEPAAAAPTPLIIPSPIAEPVVAPQQQQMVRAVAAPKRTAIPEPITGDPASQYVFLHEDNYFALQANGSSPPRTKFQLSIRFEMVSLFETNNIMINLAYTQKSFWDMLDFAHSSPFVESDYHPELFVSYRRHRSIRYREVQLGCQHESNGLGAVGNVDQTADSRSWNSCFVQGNWGFTRNPGSDPWFFPSLGVRLWQPFWSDQPVVDAIGHGQIFFDLDLSVPHHLAFGRFSNRLTLREHGIQDDLLYAILPVATSGRIRTWLFGQIFYGKAERLITAGESVTHIYVGLGFQ
ncbi:MAG TPA: phospholipase A [Polyangia bacterium]|nr:phospholipase A [Polyangia bacterium]